MHNKNGRKMIYVMNERKIKQFFLTNRKSLRKSIDCADCGPFVKIKRFHYIYQRCFGSVIFTSYYFLCWCVYFLFSLSYDILTKCK